MFKALFALALSTSLLVSCDYFKHQQAAKTNTPQQASLAPQAMQAAAPPIAPSAEADLAKLSCSKGKEARTLQIIKKDSGCLLEYTKAGKMTSAAKATDGGLKHCIDSEKRIRNKLEGSGYNCA